MKNIIKKIMFLALTVILLQSCVEESKFVNPVHFGLENGAFAKLSNASPRTTVLLNDFLANGYVSDQLNDANNNMIKYSLTMVANIGGTVTSIEDFIVKESFPTDFEITAQSIADALAIPVSDINFGDSFTFVAVTTRDDNIQFNGNSPTFNEGDSVIVGDETVGGGNTEGTLNTPSTGYFSAMNFNFIIACDAFPPSDVTGTYNITQSSFFSALGETSTVREVIGGPFDGVITEDNGSTHNLVLADNQIAILGGEWATVSDYASDDLILTITPNGIMVEDGYNEDGVAIPAGTAGLIENTYQIEKAIVLPCVNKIDINLNISPYTANEHKFILERI